MKKPLPSLTSCLAACLALSASPLLACGYGYEFPAAPMAAEDYTAVATKLAAALDSIHQDLAALEKTGQFPQLKGIQEAKIQRSEDGGSHLKLSHQKAVTALPRDIGEDLLIGKDGCSIQVELLSYDAKSDPRFSTGARTCRPLPHFLVKSNGVPYGLECSVSAEDSEAGKAFTQRVNQLVEARLENLRKELRAIEIDWSELVDKRQPLAAAELEKAALIMIEGTVTAHSTELYQETGMPQRVSVKVTQVLGGRHGYETKTKVGDVIPLDTWGLKPTIDLPVGASIKGYLSIGAPVNPENGEGSYYYPVAVNAVQVGK